MIFLKWSEITNTLKNCVSGENSPVQVYGDMEEPNREEFIENIPREVATEHIQTRKCSIDAIDMCEPCCLTYCRENGIHRYTKVFTHDVMKQRDIDERYAVEKCAKCQIGLMAIFGWRNCPACHCERCNALPSGTGRCAACERCQLTYCLTIRTCRN